MESGVFAVGLAGAGEPTMGCGTAASATFENELVAFAVKAATRYAYVVPASAVVSLKLVTSAATVVSKENCAPLTARSIRNPDSFDELSSQETVNSAAFKTETRAVRPPHIANTCARKGNLISRHSATSATNLD
jgi:hypothetical protein